MRITFSLRKAFRIITVSLALSSLAGQAHSQLQAIRLPEQQRRWQIQQDGSIYWAIDGNLPPGVNLPHNDHIEMSGQKVSLWVQYEVDSAKKLHLKRTVVFPAFRMKPNDTHSSLMQVINDEDLPHFYVNNKPLKPDLVNGRFLSGLPERVMGIRLNGIMEADSRIEGATGIVIRRSLFPSVSLPMAIEKIVFTNKGDKAVTIDMDQVFREVRVDTFRSFHSPYSLLLTTLENSSGVLQPGDSAVFAIGYQAATDIASAVKANPDREELARKERILGFAQSLQLNTPDSVLNTAFAFAKIRAAESIFKTKAGYMHSPGGLAYYAAIWANDQAEYVNPFFAFLGDTIAIQSAMNAYRLFAAYMNPEYKPIPSSIIAEGDGYWNGAGDRGDQAMIAYGASRFALAYGNRDAALKLWPLIGWCLEYLERKVNADGVVASRSDELEGRFPAGEANLSTSSMYYDALISAGKLGKSIGVPRRQLEAYLHQAKVLRSAIEKYFGASMEGFNTYRYFKDNTVLRSWICMPLTVGIYDRKEGTINALFSPYLFTPDGLLTQAGDKTFWDRSTLYALRGALASGATETALSYLHYYSARRLLGEHVPYPVEAYPEGNQRHLSAESGLYCRIFTEGLFGIRPTGLRSFDCTPRLPEEWNTMQLRHIKAFESDFDITVKRIGTDKLRVSITDGKSKAREYLIRSGGTVPVMLAH